MSVFRDGLLEPLTRDPLSAQARSQHRNLILSGALAILVAHLNLVPTRISAIGVDLQSNDRHVVRLALLLTVVYFFVAFMSSAIPDLLAVFATQANAVTGRRRVGELVAETAAKLAETDEEIQARAPSSPHVVETFRREAIDQMIDAQRRQTLYVFLVPKRLRAPDERLRCAARRRGHRDRLARDNPVTRAVADWPGRCKRLSAGLADHTPGAAHFPAETF